MGAGAGADGPSAEGASERASRASCRRHGPERPDGHGRGLRRPGAACGLGPSPGPLARSLLPRPPSAPSLDSPRGPRPARLHPPGPAPRPRPPPEPAPGPQGRPEAWAVPSLPIPPEGSRPLPQPGPSLLGSPPVPAGGTPTPGLRAQPALAPPPHPGSGCVPGPLLRRPARWARPPQPGPGHPRSRGVSAAASPAPEKGPEAPGCVGRVLCILHCRVVPARFSFYWALFGGGLGS